jgi:hypothetical protein
VTVTGTVSNRSGRCPALTFTVNAVIVTTSAATDFEKGNCGDVENGKRVDAIGVVTAGQLAATTVRILKGNDH